MNMQDLPGGIPSRVTGLTSGILRHLLAIGSLAALEARLFLRQSITALLLLLAIVVVAMIAYVALIGAAIALLATTFKWGWPVSLASAGILHLGILGFLYRFLRVRVVAPRPFEATAAEIRKDIDALGNYAGSASSTASR
jgi:Putative Actinobacterial Holin-X, holin superfamily III